MWVGLKNGWIWFMSEYDICVNMNYGWIWIMGEYELWVNMINVWIWIMGECELWLGTHRQKDIHTHTQAGPSEKHCRSLNSVLKVGFRMWTLKYMFLVWYRSCDISTKVVFKLLHFLLILEHMYPKNCTKYICGFVLIFVMPLCIVIH